MPGSKWFLTSTVESSEENTRFYVTLHSVLDFVLLHTLLCLIEMEIYINIYIYIYLFSSFELSLYYNRHGLIFLVSFQHCVPSMSVKRFSGFNVKTVLSGANCQPMHFFRQSGPVRITHGTQKGRPSSISISETWAFHPIYFI